MNNIKFEKWLTPYLNKGKGYIAYNFNLYEFEGEDAYGAELVAANSYDRDDDDWACDTVYSSGDDLFEFESENWQTALIEFLTWVAAFIADNGIAPFGDKVEFITAGFIDGNLHVIYPQEAE
ncbi:MAG: hypothetical protein IJ489_11690 [Clostridia bacterium]|nr:hypothetical protein [Clostridia bacterium]